MVAVVVADAEARRQEEKAQMAWLAAMDQADLLGLVALEVLEEQTRHLQNQKMQEMGGKGDTGKAAKRAYLCNSRTIRRLPQTYENGRYIVRRFRFTEARLQETQPLHICGY